MLITFKAFCLQKEGNDIAEYEDAYSPRILETDKHSEFRCAVADGATETSFSGLWAKILVDAFVEEDLSTIDQLRMKDLSLKWREEIALLTKDKPLSWYAEEKLERGAFSSLMGLHIKADGQWEAAWVGDSCLFQLRPPSYRKSYPYTEPDEFNNHPALISTNALDNSKISASTVRGKWREGDCFLLMTDALAHYFLSDKSLRSKLLPSLLNQELFEEIIHTARAAKLCRNDDVTLLKVCIKPGVRNGGMA
jgi:serine/threonine protein phosphatase PrpC